MIRIPHFSARAAVAGLILTAAAFGADAALANDDEEVIHACASKSNGSLRVVGSPSECRNNERAIEWSKESPIPTPQACPAGEFVTGIDSFGQLVCAAPGGDGGGGSGGTDCPATLPALTNATTGCSSGVILIAACDSGFYDLNGIVADGCEYGPVFPTGPEVCDGIDNDADGQVDENVAISVTNGETTCQNGTIVLVCNTGFADLNGVLSDGCEAPVPT